MEILRSISQVILLLAIAAAAAADIHTKHLPWLLPAGVFVSGVTYQLIAQTSGIWQLLGGCAVGGALVIISLLSRQAMGLGDALMFIASGAFLGLYDNLFLLLISVSLSAICSLILLIVLKAKGKYSFPFMPFMLLGYICLLLLV